MSHGPSKPVRKAALKNPTGKKPAAKSSGVHRKLLASLVSNATAAPSGTPAQALANGLSSDPRVTADVQAKYGGQESTLKQQQAQTPGYFKQYQDQLNAATQANAAAAQAAQTQFGQTAAGLSTADAARAGQVSQQQSADAALRGASVDPSLAQGSADAASVRRSMLAGMANEAAANGQNQGALDAQSTKTGAAQFLGAQQGIMQQLAQLQADKGSFALGQQAQYAAADSAAAEKAQNDALNQAIAEKTLGINQTNATTKSETPNKYGYTNAQWSAMTPEQRTAAIKKYTSASTPPKTPKTPTASDKKTAADLAFFKAHGYYPPTGPPKTPKSKKPTSATPAAQGGARSSISGGLAAAKNLQQTGGAPGDIKYTLLNGQPATPAKVIYDKHGKPKLNADGTRQMTDPQPALAKIDPEYVNVIMDLLLNHYISPANVKLLHARGIKVNALGYPITAPAKKVVPVATLTPGAGGTANVGTVK